jgi:hypothetical protein
MQVLAATISELERRGKRLSELESHARSVRPARAAAYP